MFVSVNYYHFRSCKLQKEMLTDSFEILNLERGDNTVVLFYGKYWFFFPKFGLLMQVARFLVHLIRVLDPLYYLFPFRSCVSHRHISPCHMRTTLAISDTFERNPNHGPERKHRKAVASASVSWSCSSLETLHRLLVLPVDLVVHCVLLDNHNCFG
jgi:hypothetical protein